MAKSSKKKADQTKAEAAEVDPIESAEEAIEAIVEDVPAVQSDETVDAEALPDDALEDDALEDDAAADDEATFEAEAGEDDDGIQDVAPDQPSEVAEHREPQTPAPQKTGAGFIAMLLGGVAAGAIGYGIGQYDPSGNTTLDVDRLITEQAARIDALQAELNDMPDLAPVVAQIDEVKANLAAELTDLGGQLRDEAATIDMRLTELEKRPNADGTLSDAALSAYQSELEALRAELEAQKQDVTDLAAQAQADLEAARAEAALVEQRAIATAQAAAARAAVNRVAAAAETGAPFAEVLTDPSLAQIDVPAALTEVAETGVPTTAQLATAFPEAARAALAAARTEGQSDDAGGLGGFLRNQFDVRSTTPQEGPGADAVLSRAEAAIKDGRVADALAEIEGLPEVARAAMTDWTAQAQSRSDALAAIATLSETLNSN